MNSSIGFAPGLLDDLAKMPQVEAVGGYDTNPPLYAGDGAAFDSARIDSALLAMLSARALHGRLLTDQDPDDSMMLSESVWRARFGADPGIVGRSIDFDGVRLNVVGVVSDAFRLRIARPNAVATAHRTPSKRKRGGRRHFGVPADGARRGGRCAARIRAALGALAPNRPARAERQFMGLTCAPWRCGSAGWGRSGQIELSERRSRGAVCAARERRIIVDVARPAAGEEARRRSALGARGSDARELIHEWCLSSRSCRPGWLCRDAWPARARVVVCSRTTPSADPALPRFAPRCGTACSSSRSPLAPYDRPPPQTRSLRARIFAPQATVAVRSGARDCWR